MSQWWADFIALAPALWPALLVIAGVGALARLPRWRAWYRARMIGTERWDTLSGAQFEQFLAAFFRRAGWQVQHVGGPGDFGADLVITYAGYRTAVQAKRSATPVGLDAVQEVAAARDQYGCHYALVVTTASYTAAAQSLAHSCGVELWDRADLEAEVERYGG